MTSATPLPPHVVTSYEGELKTLESSISRLAAAAVEQLENAIDAMVHLDVAKACAVVERDAELDALDDDVEAACVRILALRQPHADDLRLTITTIKASNELERIGDLAKNIAKRVESVAKFPAMAAAQSLPHLKDLAVVSLRRAAQAFAERDADLARAVWGNDAPLDAAYTSLFREIVTYMLEDQAAITPSTHLLFAAKNLERVGDHATNIAEMAFYLASGTRLEGTRPKDDQSPFVAPGAGGI
ncbi:MAG: phosphate signaling complex protein PhoU [Rhodospirillaceae bacterium]